MKTVCLLSGGIDSPVAAYLIGKNDCEVTLLHMDNRPYSDDSNYEKAIDLKNRLEAELCRKIPLYIAPHGPSQESIKEKCRGNLQCVVCKRVMLRVAKKLAQQVGADFISTGESLGQVASQTLQNIVAEEYKLEFPVVRPLIGLDKLEIENIAKTIGTYEISIRKGVSCTIVPFRPATMTSIDLMVEQENLLNITEVVEKSVSSIKLYE